ncbi:hypothetical protein ABQE69_09215 [Mycolicibacillus trivialis]
MNDYPRREVYMKLISRDALNAYITARQTSTRKLAVACGSEKHRSTIAHLRSGARTTCGPEIAGRIEKALGAPAGSLFLVEMANANVAIRRTA